MTSFDLVAESKSGRIRVLTDGASAQVVEGEQRIRPPISVDETARIAVSDDADYLAIVAGMIPTLHIYVFQDGTWRLGFSRRLSWWPERLDWVSDAPPEVKIESQLWTQGFYLWSQGWMPSRK